MFFGRFGGQEVPDFLLPALQELEAAYVEAMGDEAFLAEFEQLRRDYLGRPSALFECRNISTEHVKIILKREDLVHGGAHKGNNVLGQGLLAKRMGKKRLIAETGAGQHGTATAMVAALLGLDCTIYMGAHDVARQKPNVERMELMGATVVSVTQGNSSLKDAIDVALEEWAVHLDDTFYLLGTAAGPHPWPTMVRDFHSVISQESKEQMLERYGRLPDEVIAAVGGGSNAIGAFANYIDEAEVELVGVEPGGEGLETGKHGAPICAGKVGVLHGMRSYVMLDETGEVTASHSVSAGLDYPSVGPEHSALHDSGRAVYVPINDDEAVRAFRELSRREGIIPAMESSHGLAQAFKAAAAYEQAVAEGAESVVLVDGGREIAVRGTDEPLLLLVNLSGRGDKDMEQVADRLAALN
ncbi:MAG: tryptophan synthase subunit beta [Corynebacterium sp.]|nr:tryptophan synthase subunit beta [Corynebacterium sp.]